MKNSRDKPLLGGVDELWSRDYLHAKATKHTEKSAEIYSLFITVYTVGCIESGANTNKQKQTPFSQTNSFFYTINYSLHTLRQHLWQSIDSEVHSKGKTMYGYIKILYMYINKTEQNIEPD